MNITVRRYATPNEVAEAFLRNEIDVAGLYSGQIVDIIDRGGAVYPFITYEVEDRIKRTTCLWENREKATGDISDVYGKTLIGRTYEMPFPYISLRDYLYGEGIDKPLWKVFKSFTFVDGDNSGFMALAVGDADYKWSTEDFRLVLKLFLPQVLPKLSVKLCSEPVITNMMLVFNRNTVSKEICELMKSRFGEIMEEFNAIAKEDPDFKMVKQYMKMLYVDLVPAGDELFTYETDLYRRANEKGWMDEAEFMMKQINDAPRGKPITIKPDFMICKQLCGGEDYEKDCLNKCME